MVLYRSFLFAPGNHARRVEKALGLDADAVILDLGLGQESSLKLLTEIYERCPQIPVLMVTAKQSIEDAIFSLENGAADDLSKPVAGDKLVARVPLLHALRPESLLPNTLRRYVDFVAAPGGADETPRFQGVDC